MFADNIYHRQRYEALQDIALEMFALATGELPEQLEPLRATVMRQPSAISTADTAIIDEAGRMLLIRRADNGRWAMPGGLLEVGETRPGCRAGGFRGIRCALRAASAGGRT